MRKIQTKTNPANGVKTEVFFDTDLSEYIVRVFRNGNRQQGADYYTDDKTDALQTAAVIRGE